jgi:hypothetical protein
MAPSARLEDQPSDLVPEGIRAVAATAADEDAIDVRLVERIGDPSLAVADIAREILLDALRDNP